MTRRETARVTQTTTLARVGGSISPLLLLLTLAAVGCEPGCARAGKGVTEPVASAPPRSPGADANTVVFKGMCDASGAVVLGGTRFAVGDDEDNVLRVYDSARGGEPLDGIDVSPALDLPIKKKTPEADIEAATRVGDRALWLTSHGRNSSGKLQPGRLRFFATTAPTEGTDLTPVGVAYHGLLDDMHANPALARFNLMAASELAPKERGGLNIEGMTRRPDGTSVLLGFRNPRPEGKALTVPLLNPLQVTEGARAQFGEPRLLDLGGLGVRALSLWRGQYLIIAGAIADEADSHLFIWDGADRLRKLDDIHLERFNPEAFVSRDESDRVLLLSDDGAVEIEGKPCKKQKDGRLKQFRGVWVEIPG